MARSRYDADKLTSVIERMSTYPQLSFPLMIQKLVAARIGGGEDPLEQRLEGWRRQAQYLSTVNLSSSCRIGIMPSRLHPRPKGRATKVIYTEYDLPQRTRQPHDVIVDSEGMAWYASFGEQILGKTRSQDRQGHRIPGSAAQARICPPAAWRCASTKMKTSGSECSSRAAVAKFDKKTEKFQTWSLPPELNGDHVQINQVSPEHHKVDGKVWLQDAGTYTVLRLDLKSGKFEVFEPYAIPRPNIYDVISDPQNNVYFTVFGERDIGRIDAKTGKIDIVPDADARLRTAPRHDGSRRHALVRRKPRRSHRDVRHARPSNFKEWMRADAGVLALRCDCRQERRSLVRRRVQRSRAAPESEDRRDRRVSAAAVHECPPGFR